MFEINQRFKGHFLNELPVSFEKVLLNGYFADLLWRPNIFFFSTNCLMYTKSNSGFLNNSVRVYPIRLKIDMLDHSFLDICQCAFKWFELSSTVNRRPSYAHFQMCLQKCMDIGYYINSTKPTFFYFLEVFFSPRSFGLKWSSISVQLNLQKAILFCQCWTAKFQTHKFGANKISCVV